MGEMKGAAIGMEQVLAKHLAPVQAPENLCVPQRSAYPQATPKKACNFGVLAASLSAAAAIAVLFLLWLRPPASDLHSADPVQVSAWLKSRSFDVPLRNAPPSSIRLTRAQVKGSIAEIDYLVAGREVVLTVSPPSSQPPDTPYHVVRSHLVRGQLYTLSCAFPQDARTACLLCHAGGDVN
jgi:hypothetical protein